MRFIVFALLFLALPSLVLADIAIPGQKQIDFCYNITNMDKYPDYVFLIHDKYTSRFTLEIKPGDCFSFYKIGRPEVFAVKKSDYVEEEARNEEYFSGPKTIPSGFQLSAKGSVTVLDPLDKVTTLLEIVSLNDTKLEIKKIDAIKTYVGGASINERIDTDLTSQDMVSNFSNIWYIVTPILAIAIIILILLKRRSK